MSQLLFDRFAETSRAVQRKAIELENHPDGRKQLRRFGAREVARILGISQGHLRNLVRTDGFPRGLQTGNGRRSFAYEDIAAARHWLHDQNGGRRHRPGRRPNERLQVLAFVNFKGGSGKTTSAIHFAQYLALHGYRVLLADLDPQASATALFGLAPDSDVAIEDTFAGWIRRSDDSEPVAPRATYWPDLDLLPANIGLQHAEYDLVGRLLRQRAFPFYAELDGLLRRLEEHYDVVVCDCRPDVGMLTINALIAATALVVPIPPAMIEFASSGEFFRFMGEVARDFQGGVSEDLMNYDFVRVLTTKFRPADRNQAEIVRWQQAFFQDAVLRHAMVETAVLDAAGIIKETLYEYEPSGNRRSHERALEAVNAVNAELLAAVHAAWGRAPDHAEEAA